MSLILLLFLHHIGDVFQPSWLIANKKYHWFAIYEHVIIYSGVVSLGLLLLGEFKVWKFVFLIVTHFLTDYVKYQVLPKKFGERYEYIYPDQLLHYLQVLFVHFL